MKIPEDLTLDFDAIRRQIKDIPQSMQYGVPELSAFADFVYSTLRFSEAGSGDITRATKGNAWQVTQDTAAPGHFHDAPGTRTLNELSVRTAKAMPRYAKAFAWFNGDSKATPAHLKTILPYLLWHKIIPASKALAEDPRYANDRIALVRDLIEEIETDYAELSGSPVIKTYAAALQTIRTGKIADKPLTPDQVRSVARNAIAQVGAVDKAYALNLAHHIATEYNQTVAKSHETQ